jgi:hypothetical protein
VNLKIYDAVGKEITILLDKHLQPGHYSIEWDASSFSTGIYFYRIEAGEFNATKKLLLLK